MSSDLEQLDARLVEVLSGLGVENLTLPQVEAMEPILAGRSVLICAPTGMGKTEAAAMPALSALASRPAVEVEVPGTRKRRKRNGDGELEDAPPPGPSKMMTGIRMLYVTPLRALNRDMFSRLFRFGEALGMEVGMRHGDTKQSERNRQSKKPPAVLITTPETLQILLVSPRFKYYLKSVEIAVLDEIHEFASDERGSQFAVGLERLDNWCGRLVQRIGLSATVGDVEQVANFLCGGRGVHRVVIPQATTNPLEVTVECPPVEEEIDAALSGELMCDLEAAASLRRSHDLIQKFPGTLLFSNTRNTAEVLALRFQVLDPGLAVGVHHGSLFRDIRIDMESQFKDRDLDALICTSSLELGIDIGHVERVIQYNSPRDPARLIQRVGRAGHHHERTSIGVVLATEVDDLLEAAVIARRAMAGLVEQERARKMPLNVLANQIIAMALHDEVDLDGALRIIRRAWPFHDLPEDVFFSVVNSLMDQHLLWRDDDRVRKKRRAFQYFFSNISMIPDRRNFPVRDITSGRMIGTLDESFVLTLEETRPLFVMKGRCWKLVELGDEEIAVEPVATLADAPTWIGEEIPIPYAVAQEVGRVRRTVDLEGYPVDERAEGRIRDALLAQAEVGPVGTDELVTIEEVDRGVVLNVCGGTVLNETLGRLLSALITTRSGAGVQLDSDAYRITLRSAHRLTPQSVIEMIENTDPEHLTPMLRIVMRNSASLQWHLLLTARHFGVVSRDADFRRVNLQRVLDDYRESVLFDEAIDRMFHDRLDLDGATRFLQRIRQREVQIQPCRRTPLGQPRPKDKRLTLAPPMADREILQAVKRRILRSRPTLVCVACGSRRSIQLEKFIPARLGEERMEKRPEANCRRCDSSMLAVLRYDADNAIRLVKKRPDRRTRAEEKEIGKLFKSASLFKYHRERALLALCSRGVGEGAAARVLEKHHVAEEDFLRELLKLEINYARTRRFWD